MASEIQVNSSEPPDSRDLAKESLERELERQLAPEAADLAPEKRRAIVEKTATLAIQYSGPVPPDFILRGYEAIVPGSADRIIAMAERDQAHIHEMQRLEQTQPHTYATLGMICGATIGALAIATSAIVAIYGDPWAGAAIFGTTLVAITGVFVRSRLEAPKIGAAPQMRPKAKRRK